MQTFNEVFKAYEQKHGTKLEVKYVSIEELHENRKKNAQDVASLLHIAWASGMGVVGDPSSVDNGKYAEWNPKPVIDYL